MGRRKKTTGEEQLDLIDVGPENAKAIKRIARKYCAALAERLEWLREEKKHKDKILELVEEAGLHPDEQGVVRFRVDSLTITITPRDKIVRVKPDEDEAEMEAE